MISRLKSVLPLVESLYSDIGWSIYLGVCNLNYTALDTASTEEPSIFTSLASNFVKKFIKPAPFHGPIFSTNAKTTLEEGRAAFIAHCTDFILGFLALLKHPLSYTRMTSIPMLQMFSTACVRPATTQGEGRSLEGTF